MADEALIFFKALLYLFAFPLTDSSIHMHIHVDLSHFWFSCTVSSDHIYHEDINPADVDLLCKCYSLILLLSILFVQYWAPNKVYFQMNCHIFRDASC